MYLKVFGGIGAIALAIVGGIWWVVDTSLRGVELAISSQNERLAAIEGRFNSLDTKIDSLSSLMQQRFDILQTSQSELIARTAALESGMGARLDALAEAIRDIDYDNPSMLKDDFNTWMTDLKSDPLNGTALFEPIKEFEEWVIIRDSNTGSCFAELQKNANGVVAWATPSKEFQRIQGVSFSIPTRHAADGQEIFSEHIVEAYAIREGVPSDSLALLDNSAQMDGRIAPFAKRFSNVIAVNNLFVNALASDVPDQVGFRMAGSGEDFQVVDLGGLSDAITALYFICPERN